MFLDKACKSDMCHPILDVSCVGEIEATGSVELGGAVIIGNFSKYPMSPFCWITSFGLFDVPPSCETEVGEAITARFKWGCDTWKIVGGLDVCVTSRKSGVERVSDRWSRAGTEKMVLFDTRCARDVVAVKTWVIWGGNRLRYSTIVYRWRFCSHWASKALNHDRPASHAGNIYELRQLAQVSRSSIMICSSYH